MPTLQIIDTIHQIDREEWDSVAGENIFESYGWLKTFEHNYIGDQKPRYFLLREEGRLIAVAACYITRPSERVFNSDDTLLGRFKLYASKMGISFLPALICSPWGVFGAHFSFAKHLDSNQAESAATELIQSIENFAYNHQLPILFHNVMDHEISLLRSLNERRYSRAETFPVCYLDVEWSSFEDYLTSVKRISKGNAKMIRREINKNRSEGVVIQQLETADGFQEHLYDLVNRNYLNHNGKPFPYRKAYFKSLKENLGTDAVIYTATKKNKLIGVTVCFREKKSSYLSYIGVDHDSAGNDFTYFNLAYYHPIRDAILDRIERMYYGQALYSVKTRRGCKISNTYTFYKPYRKISQIAVKPWFWLLSLWYRKKTAREVTRFASHRTAVTGDEDGT